MPSPFKAEAFHNLRELAAGYPEGLRERQLEDIPRIHFHLQLLLENLPTSAAVADIGGGVGLFALGARSLGYEATLVDDFNDPVNDEYGDEALAQHRRAGVVITSRDVIADGVDFEPASFDAVTSFDTIEHWHHSPRNLLRQLVDVLKPGGLFILGAPNCANLRKRLGMLIGRGKWSGMAEWYDAPIFRGHVREPDIADLRYIADDMGLSQVAIFGRNWQGRASRSGLVRAITAVLDLPLRVSPGLCSDIYMVGRKPGG